MIKHGMRNTRLYRIWIGMRKRCSDKNSTNYDRYGGRGIKVCDEWQDFCKFAEWALPNGFVEHAKRGECTIERVDNDGDYCPENCVWANAKRQANNRSSNHLVEYDGEKYTITQLSEKFGIRKDTLRRRLLHGWSVYDAVTKPIKTNGVWRPLGNEAKQCVYITTREAAKLIGAQRQVTYSLCADEIIGYCYGQKNKKTYQIVPSKLANFMEISEQELLNRLIVVRESEVR